MYYSTVLNELQSGLLYLDTLGPGLIRISDLARYGRLNIYQYTENGIKMCKMFIHVQKK